MPQQSRVCPRSRCGRFGAPAELRGEREFAFVLKEALAAAISILGVSMFDAARNNKKVVQIFVDDHAAVFWRRVPT